MYSKMFGGSTLSVEFRSGVGLDIEFAHSRPVWVNEVEKDQWSPMCFEGVVFCVPFFMISFGKVYEAGK